MRVTQKVKKILDCYEGDPPGVKANLARILCTGKPGGTGKVVTLPVDQGFEHGPARSSAPNPPAAVVSLEAAKKSYEKFDGSMLAKRVAHVMQASFSGKRIVVFSGGEAKDLDGVYEEVRGIRDGGANGSIIGRNTFQRPKEKARWRC